jgi:hypothetical protein
MRSSIIFVRRVAWWVAEGREVTERVGVYA